MSEHAVDRWRELTEPTATVARSASNAWWGMVLIVATEGALFAVMLASYFYIRWQADGGWPPDGKDPALLRPSLIAAALVLSATTMALAEAGIRRGSTRRLTAGLLATLALGGAFVALQSIDYVAKLPDTSPQDGAYDSLTYVITGAHAVHVVVGMLLLMWIQGRAWTGAYDERRHVGVDVIALYWYFLVAVELTIYASLFISPYL